MVEIHGPDPIGTMGNHGALWPSASPVASLATDSAPAVRDSDDSGFLVRILWDSWKFMGFK